MEYADGEYLTRLSALIRPQIALPFAGLAAPIDEPLANFAVKRHRVGPILHKASHHGLDMDDGAASILSSSYDKNIRTILAQRAASRNLAALLNEHAIPFSILKGLGIADQIYDDPQTRQSKDIDILIPPEASRAAVQLLNDNGYFYRSNSLRSKRPAQLDRQLSSMKLLKDLTFIDPKYSTIIELHQRLFKIEPKNLTADFTAAIRFEKIPSVADSHYCLYFILHGAISLWSRLKWLVDLSLWVRKISIQERRELMNLAKTCHCEKAVIASLRFVDEIFAGSLDEDWNAILCDQEYDGEIHALTGLFRQTLLTSCPDRPDIPAKRRIFFAPAAIIFGRQINILKLIWSRVATSVMIRI